MRKLFVSLLCLVTMPAVALDDACTKPKEFTVDKRCYVTTAQKMQKPFNATVALIDDGQTYCSGTIVKGFDGYNNTKATAQDKGTIFLYTAKHCTDNDGDGEPDANLKIKLQDGSTYTAKLAYAGDFDESTDENKRGDYAVYTIIGAKPDIPYTTVRKWGTNGFSVTDARVIGYGFLKIMSDAEIHDFRYKYLKYLGTRQDKTYMNELKLDVAKLHLEDFIEELIETDRKYAVDLFADGELKVSECKYFSNGAQWNCQSWYGNSGCGIFDNIGNLMGVLSRGNAIIGGREHHAGKDTLMKSPFSEDLRQSTVPVAFW